MQRNRSLVQSFAARTLAVSVFFSIPSVLAQPDTGAPQLLSTGQLITPLAPIGAAFQPLNPNLTDDPAYTVGQAVTTVVSPDGNTLLILTSGYNLWNYTTGANAGKTNPADSNEYVFI
jgi:hypothetical protein